MASPEQSAARMQIPKMTEAEYRQFSELIHQEAVSPLGELQRLNLIEDMIRARLANRIDRILQNLLQKGHPEDRARKFLNTVVQPIHIDHFRVGSETHNLIVSKGSGREADYTIMIPAHVDTVGPADREDLLQLRRDPVDGDRLRGRGVWDMGGALLNSIALAVDSKVPPGMQVYFVFTVDEEGNSEGALNLIVRWPEWQKVDLVLSSEIGQLVAPPGPEDKKMRIILGRRGRGKFTAQLSLDERKLGHGARDDLPDLHTEHVIACWYLLNRFRSGGTMLHSFLGQEGLEVVTQWGRQHKPGGFGNLQSLEWHYALKIVPPNSLAEAIAVQTAIFKEIATKRDWVKRGIGHLLSPRGDETSYEPFCMEPDDCASVHVVSNAIEKVSGQAAVLTGGRSVADENLYAATMFERLGTRTFAGTDKGVISVPMIGNHAHSSNEWVSSWDIMRVREVFRFLIEHEEGFSQFLKSRRTAQQ